MTVKNNGASTTPMEREQRLARIAEKRRMGYTLEQIGIQEGVSAVMVWKEERKIIKRLQERQIGEYADYVAIRCDELRALRKEAWKEWYRSRADARRLTTEEGLVGEGEDGEPTAVEVMRLVKRIEMREGRIGEAAYLNVVLKTYEQEDKLRGYVKNQTTINNTNVVSTSPPGLQGLLDAPPDPVAERLAAAAELPDRSAP